MQSAHRPMRRRATACAIAAAATALIAGPAIAPAAATTAPSEDERPRIELAAVDPLLSDGETLEVDLTIDTQGTAATAATTVDLLLTTEPISTRYSLSRWFDGEAFMASTVVATVGVPAIAANNSVTVRTTVDAAVHGLDARAWGAYGLAVASTDFGGSSTVVVRDEPGEASATRVALAAPITSEVGADGLLDTDALTTLTEAGGEARVALDAAVAAGATVGLDPAIGASVEALGDDAPDAAVSWLEAANLPTTYPLLYAGADPISQVRAGTYPLQPLGIPTASDELLPPTAGFAGTRSPVFDATQATLDRADLETLGSAGTLVVASSALDESLSGATPSAHTSIDGVDAVVADAELQSLLRAAVTAEGVEAGDLRARVLALLATVTRERPSDPRTLAAVLPASADGDSTAVLAALGAASFVTTAGIDAALETPAREASLLTTEDPARDAGAQLVNNALEQEAEVSRIASIVDEPDALLAELRLSLLAALPVAGRDVTSGDEAAIQRLGDSMSAIRNGVQLVSGSDIHAVGESVGLPITITNELDVPANVVLSVRPTNALVTVASPELDVTVAPNSQQRVQVPMTVVGTGSLQMVVQLHTPDGQPLSQSQSLRISAQPTIEAVVAWVLGLSIVLLLGFGILRSIQKRRRGEARGDIDDTEASNAEQAEGTAASAANEEQA